jgi:hypothetical protein
MPAPACVSWAPATPENSVRAPATALANNVFLVFMPSPSFLTAHQTENLPARPWLEIAGIDCY